MRKIFFTLLTVLAFVGQGQGLRELYQEGLKAYEDKNYELFRDKMYAIDTMRPNYPAVVYNLAGGYVLTGQTDNAIATLNNYILMDATQDFTKDSDFETIINTPAFEIIRKKQLELTSEIAIEEGMRWELNAAHPESITYSKRAKSYFIGGARDGRIWKIKEGSQPEVFSESPKDSWAVMGLEVSPDERTLYVCTSALNQYEKFEQIDEGYASILVYDIRSGKLLRTYKEEGGHIFGDLIVNKKGDVFISDGTSNKLYWISNETEELEVFVDLSERIFNMQGLTFNADQSSIYLSDYIDGIYKVDLKSKEVSKLALKADDILIKGIDGLYWKDNSLIGLHNGTKPNRIISYQLSEDENIIVDKKVLAQAGYLGEPTQGVFVGNIFYYIANSPWAAYDQDGNFNPTEPSVIIGQIK